MEFDLNKWIEQQSDVIELWLDEELDEKESNALISAWDFVW